MKAYLQVYCWFEQDDWVRWLAIAKFAYNNSRQASTIMGPFKSQLGYHASMFYEDNWKLQLKS